MMRLIILATLAVGMLAGCSGNRSVVKLDARWTDLGKTTRAQVVERYGEPSAYFEEGRIIAYRVTRGRSTESITQTRLLGHADANLIFVFDANGVLQRQSRVELKQ